MVVCICGETKGLTKAIDGYRFNDSGELIGCKFDVIKCANCGLVRQDVPFKSEKEYNEFYSDYIPGKAGFHKDFLHNMRVARLRLVDYGIAGDYGARLLDIGSGDGAFLHAARLTGLDAYGCEIKPYDNAKELNRTYQTRFEEAAFPTDYFNYITCHDVLEHVINPLEAVLEIIRVLKQDGTCFIDVPRFYHQSGKHHWKYLEHIWFFTEDQLENILTTAGFTIRKVYHPIESKTVFVCSKPKQKRTKILMPPGIGDSYWSIVKLESFIERYNTGLPDVYQLIQKTRVAQNEKLANRATSFLEMFPFLAAKGVHYQREGKKVRAIWREAYLRPGRTVFKDVLGFDYMLAYNGRFRAGETLEEADNLKCNWYPKRFVSLAEERFKEDCMQTYGKYAVFYFVFHGTYKNWSDQFPVDEVIKAVNLIVSKTGLTPIFVGAAWDAGNDQLKHLIKSVPKAINMLGQTSLEQLFGLLRGSELVVGYPSGLTIMATVLKAKTLIIWNHYYNTAFWFNSCPPDARYTNYYVDCTDGLIAEYLSDRCLAIVENKHFNAKPLSWATDLENRRNNKNRAARAKMCF